VKNIFMAIAKLLGLYLIFNGILVFALAAAAPSVPRDTGTSYQWLQFGIPTLTIVLGSCLIAYPEQLAKFVGITDAMTTTSFSAEAFLRIGIVLIGVNYGTEIISGLVPKLAYLFSNYSADSLKSSVSNLVGIAFALFLVFRAGKIASFIERANGAS
jgi:uncharacterized membrane protein YadS